MRTCLVLFSLLSVTVAYNKDYVGRGLVKLRCYQCNQPYQCVHGICYGDVCVKTSISQNNAYVSKGCENISHTTSMSQYEPQVKLKSYCKTEVVFGIESSICYCRNEDFCNHASQFLPSLALILLFRIL